MMTLVLSVWNHKDCSGCGSAATQTKGPGFDLPVCFITKTLDMQYHKMNTDFANFGNHVQVIKVMFSLA